MDFTSTLSLTSYFLLFKNFLIGPIRKMVPPWSHHHQHTRDDSDGVWYFLFGPIRLTYGHTQQVHGVWSHRACFSDLTRVVAEHWHTGLGVAALGLAPLIGSIIILTSFTIHSNNSNGDKSLSRRVEVFYTRGKHIRSVIIAIALGHNFRLGIMCQMLS